MNDKTNAAKPKGDAITCNLHNPTRARRVIYDGINVEGVQGQGNVQRAITVEAGETKRNVTISRFVAEELRERNRAKKDSDLKVLPVTADEPTKEIKEDAAA